MDKAIRNASAPGVLVGLLASPSLLAAQMLGREPTQIPTPPVAETGMTGIAAFGMLLALLAIVGIAGGLYDVTRKHEEQAHYLQARATDALLETPDLALLPIAATARVPLWRPAAAVVTVTGVVPTPEQRDAAMRTVIGKLYVTWPSARIEDGILVDPLRFERAA